MGPRALKLTIAAGGLAMNLPLFAVASLVGRGARFFLVAGLIRLGGEPMARQLRKYVDRIGWSLVVGLLVLYAAFKL